MKDLISKVTFGFLMAQLVPGAVAVFSLSFLWVTFTGAAPTAIVTAAQQVATVWTSSATGVIVFLAFSTGMGMAIHGLHWAVLGFLEEYYKDQETGKLRRVCDTFWHDKPVGIQILLSPVKIWIEIGLLFWKGRRLCDIAVEENVCFIDKDNIDAFKWLEDFYLHFAQFYLHTSYAISFLCVSLFISVLFGRGLEWSGISLGILVGTWLASGFFFVIGRIQFATLFRAENSIRRDKVKALVHEGPGP